MRIFSFVLLSGLLVFSPMPGYSQSRTGYVTDMLVLTFRQGPGPSYPVIKTLESNTRLTILDEQEGYYKVRLSSGDTGWVDRQFVTFDTPKTQMIQQMKSEHAALKKQFAELSTAHAQLKDQMADLPGNAGDLRQEKEKNKHLEDRNQQLSLRIETLETESDTLFKTRMIKWFLAGFGVLLFGWILGQSVSGRHRKSRSLLD